MMFKCNQRLMGGKKQSAFNFEYPQNFLFDLDSKYTCLNRDDFSLSKVENWSEIRAKQAPQRRCFALNFNVGDLFYIYGGLDIKEGKLDDMQVLNLIDPVPTWIELFTKGDTPDQVAYSTGSLVNDQFFVIGGENSKISQINRVHVFDVPSSTWTRRENIEDKMPKIAQHCSAVWDNKIVVFSGFSDGHYSNEVLIIDTQSNQVERTKAKNGPKPRVSSNCVLYNDLLYINGGISETGSFLDDTWKFDLHNHSWTEIILKDKPIGRTGHSMNLYKDSFFLFGGKIGSFNETNELWRFDLKKETFELEHDTLMEFEKESKRHEKTKSLVNAKKSLIKTKVTLTRPKVQVNREKMMFINN